MDERMKNLNLVEILKDCPKGTKLYSPLYGDVELVKVHNNDYPIEVKLSNNTLDSFTKDGRIYMDYDGECMLFPSREERDWSKFKPTQIKKPKFDPQTLQPFDKVIVRNSNEGQWACAFFSHLRKNDKSEFKYITTVHPLAYACCIPYNEETKHLVGTNEEASEFYRYWED